MKLKRVISVLLVICMLVSLFQTNYNNVWAADNTNMSEMDALSALGIDTSAAPEGFNENDTSNPYGKDTVTVNPVKELYVVGLNESTSILNSKVTGNTTTSSIVITKENDNYLKGTIYGHNDNTSKTAKAILEKSNDGMIIANGKTYASGNYNYLDGSNTGHYLQTDEYEIKTELDSTTTGEFDIASSKVTSGNFDGNEVGNTKHLALY